jgi:surfactin synthase thioesterase subunit
MLFAGWTPPGTNVVGTGMYEVTQELRSVGVRADTYTPDQWETAVSEVESIPGATDVPIAAVGYSLGAAGATKLANALAAAGIPVQTLVAIEAWSPVPVACNV